MNFKNNLDAIRFLFLTSNVTASPMKKKEIEID